MNKIFKEFSTNAFFQIGNESLLDQYTSGKSLELYTFIRTTSNAAEIRVDQRPVKLKANQIIAVLFYIVM